MVDVISNLLCFVGAKLWPLDLFYYAFTMLIPVPARDSYSCRKLSVDGACPSLVTSVVQMPIKTIPELSKPAFWVLQKTGNAEPEDPSKPGWERSRTICARSILAWRRQGDELGIDRRGVHSWRRLRLLDTLRRERATYSRCGV